MTLPAENLVPTHPADALVLSGISQDVRNRAASIRLMVFDVDGVLTDGALYFGESGEMLKRFHTQDGHGLRLMMESGIIVALMTGRSGPIVERRAAELGIKEVTQGVRDKGQGLLDLAQRLGIGLNETGYMGDDIIDLQAMQRAGFAATVPHAPVYVAQSAHWCSRQPGGSGAVRECCDLILAAKGRLGTFLTSPGLLGPGAIQ